MSHVREMLSELRRPRRALAVAILLGLIGLGVYFTLRRLGADGSTLGNLSSQTANAYVLFDLDPGQYQFNMTVGVTTGNASLSRIPI